MRRAWTLALLIGCSSSSADPETTASTEVKTESGVVRGESSEGVRSWLGIPYAAPPVGPNRFRAPQPPAKWSTPREAKSFGPACPQVNTMTGTFRAGEEDCLSLNVWSPDPAPAQPLPVMVWIHGGAFLLGSSAQDLYNGAALARQQRVVVVSMNYRLGPLGYLAHSALAKEDPANGTGNYGLLDQRAALRWVRNNIRAFGGDDKNVTVFGESAGGMSVASHLVSPGSVGLFERAIVQSGALGLAFNFLTVPEAERQAIALGKALGCGEPLIECLRSKPFESVVDALKNPTTGPGGLFQGVLSTALWLPVVDGIFMPKQLSELYAAGAITAKVPTMLGSNLNEGTLFHSGLLGDRPITDAVAYEASLIKLLGEENAKKALALYPLDGKKPDEVVAQAESDALFACPTRRAARGLVKAGVKTFRYHFVRKPDNGIAAAFGATHGADIPFMFGNDDSTLGGVSDAGMPLREAMMRYWSRFAATGDPNGAPDVAWPRYEEASDPFLTLDTPPRAGTQLLADKCAFWDTVPPIALPKTYAD
jgi:para-nitrobenzyl esterase